MNSLVSILIISGIAVGIAYFVSIEVYLNYVMPNEQGSMRELPSTSSPPGNHASVVTIPENGTLQSAENHLEPKVISVVIGLNNTVRWVNQDAVPVSIPTPDDSSDPGFVTAVQQAKSDRGPLVTNETFEYTFTKAGKFGYHMEPGPWMRGTVVVLLPSSGK